MIELLIIVTLVWGGCGVLAYGLTFAHFQGKFPMIAAASRSDNKRFAWFMGLAGPIGLLVACLQGEPKKYGLRFR